MQKIVVIEDSSLMRIRIIKILHEHGYENVIGFNSADLIESNPQPFLNEVDLIMTDVWLPGISGIELTRKLNKDQRYCNIPIIIMSSSSDVRTINAAIKAGAINYILKPFEDHLLIEKVKKIIGDPDVIEDNEITGNAEKIKKIISIEYERALRGKQPLSFIKLKVETKDNKDCANEISKKIRKIDMVYVFEENIIIILPLTDKKGLDVVLDKIDNHLLQCKIKILEKKFITFTSDSPESIDDLLLIIL